MLCSFGRVEPFDRFHAHHSSFARNKTASARGETNTLRLSNGGDPQDGLKRIDHFDRSRISDATERLI
jgi:hypothetical protein